MPASAATRSRGGDRTRKGIGMGNALDENRFWVRLRWLDLRKVGRFRSCFAARTIWLDGEEMER
jgi:hypothetical protein